MSMFRSGVWSVVAASILAGCGATPARTDAGGADASPDVGEITDRGVAAGEDAPIDVHDFPDLPPYRDAGATADRPAPPVAGDASVASLCNSVVVEDLERLGMRSGNLLRYTGSNAMAAPSDARGLQANSVEIERRCPYRMNYARVFAYTTRTAGALQVTTAGDVTSGTFDTLLFVAPVARCGPMLGDFVCNDNDPLVTSGNRFVSRLGTAVFPMGATVLIAVGGRAMSTSAYPPGQQPRGTFGLTVTEAPGLADGAPCRQDRAAGSCVTGSSCAQSPTDIRERRCAPNGSVASAECGPMAACANGLACDRALNLCYRVARDGTACRLEASSLVRCSANSTCVETSPGNVNGVCRPDGALRARCTSTMLCAPGLVCAADAGGTPVCLRAVLAGARCSTLDSQCPATHTCVPSVPGGVTGLCQANGLFAGARCAADECTGVGLRCSTLDAPPICIATANAGETCDYVRRCVPGYSCLQQRVNDPNRGVCFQVGGDGGVCRLEVPFCNPGFQCSLPARPEAGRCVLLTRVTGEPCERLPARNRCSVGGLAGCALGPTDIISGTCQSPGSREGMTCRTTGTPCDAPLSCAAGNVCRSTSAMSCAPWLASVTCSGAGAECRANSQFAGSCAVPTPEVTPNDSITNSQALMGMGPHFLLLRVTPPESSCFSFQVPVMGRVFAQLARPGNAACNGALQLELYDFEGRLLGFDRQSTALGCAMINGADATTPALFPWARALDAGRYTVCARSNAVSTVGGELELAPNTPFTLSLSVSTAP